MTKSRSLKNMIMPNMFFKDDSRRKIISIYVYDKRIHLNFKSNLLNVKFNYQSIIKTIVIASDEIQFIL